MRVVIDGKRLSGRVEYHRFLKEALGFPDYYGNNLDALYDLLSVRDEEAELVVMNATAMHADLLSYGTDFLRTLADAAEANPRISLILVEHEVDVYAGREIDHAVVALQADPEDIDDFIRQNESYVRSRLFHWQHRTGMQKTALDPEDLWSVSLTAFAEAISDYDISLGAFYPFASLIIERRLTDYLRHEQKHSREVVVDPFILQANPGYANPETDSLIGSEIMSKVGIVDDDTLALEIDAAVNLFETYGFSFFDLAQCSPKAEKTKQACAIAVRCLLDTPILLSELRHSKHLPSKAIEKRTGLPRKILERHRKYIIAATEIVDGDFPGLAGYMRYVRKGI